MIRLTTEQAQQIEEALEDIVRVFKFETGTPVEALAAIRAARAQEQAEQEHDGHWSDCSTHNEPAYPNGECDCGGYPAEQEPVIRATLAPPAPPEVYQMRSRDAYEAGWYEAQKQKAVSPTAPVQPIEDSRVSMWKSRYLAAASDRSKLIEENNALRAAPVEPVKQEPVNFEDALEAAYWNFDARVKGYGKWNLRRQSERDAFKHSVRGICTTTVQQVDLTDDEISDAIHGKGSPLRLHDYAIRDFRAVIAADRELNK